MELDPILPLDFLAYGKLNELISFELSCNGFSFHNGPIGVGLAVLHDERAVRQTSRSFEVDGLISIFAVVHDGRIGERSPNGGVGSITNLVVHDLVMIEKRQAEGSCLSIDDHPKYPGVI